VPWREQPEMILRLICNYPDQAEETKQLVQFSQLKQKNLTFNLFYRRSREYRLFREWVGDTYTYGYGLFRPYFMAIARVFVERGWLREVDDIFYLEWPEIKAATRSSSAPSNLLELIDQRKNEMLSTLDVELPSVIFGDQPPPIAPANASWMHGTATSPGYFSGPVCRVRGIEDFEKVKPGDILVIPFSDVGWAPLFARAGAVVAESGGMLSHSSIIAREYRIPAVVSVPDAMKLRDNQTITVDGFKGEIIIHDK
jgi:pyruvate,water dikinase